MVLQVLQMDLMFAVLPTTLCRQQRGYAVALFEELLAQFDTIVESRKLSTTVGKKLHGLKWMTVMLANGMTMFAWGGCSVRHNDLWTLDKSRFITKFRNMQIDEDFKYSVYGDSAFHWNEFLKCRHDAPQLTQQQILENKGMSSCRESIEWDYGNLKRYWSYMGNKNVLRMKNMPIAEYFLSAMILYNALVSMHGNAATLYFNLNPPTFEDWISQGPRYTNNKTI